LYSKLLVPLDNSELAEQALPHVISNALAHDAAVQLLQVIDPADMTSPLLRHTLELLANVTEPDRSVTLAAWESAAREYLEAVAVRLREAGVRDVEVEVTRGNPFELIAKQAEAAGADLIVIASHGRSGFGRAVTGSVADHVMRETPNAAVLVIRARPQD
jgi:nucleotide-binding universal stress UspA family protein